jgi:hypothetical protein
MLTENVPGADNQQERPETIGWIVGFTDGEGCFSVSIVRNKTSSLNWQVMPEFVITQGDKSLNALYKIKSFFGCGNIFVNRRHDNHKENLYRFCIRSLRDINEKVVPFFRKHPLQTAKAQDFEYFAKIMDMIKKKEHLTLDGITKIVKIAGLMNVKKSRVFLESSDTNTPDPESNRREDRVRSA